MVRKMDKIDFKVPKNSVLVPSLPAMPKGRSISAGTNRSGKKRRHVISTADSTASTDSTADGPADCQAGSDQGEHLLGGQQVGGNVQLSSDRGEVIATDVVVVPEVVGGLYSGKEAVQPSPTDFNASGN